MTAFEQRVSEMRAWFESPRFKGLTRLFTRSRAARDMMRYYWETMDAAVPPEWVLEAMRAAGFAEVKRQHLLGLFSEYVARKA